MDFIGLDTLKLIFNIILQFAALAFGAGVMWMLYKGKIDNAVAGIIKTDSKIKKITEEEIPKVKKELQDNCKEDRTECQHLTCNKINEVKSIVEKGEIKRDQAREEARNQFFELRGSINSIETNLKEFMATIKGEVKSNRQRIEVTEKSIEKIFDRIESYPKNSSRKS